MAVTKIIEVVGSSPDSSDGAVKAALEDARASRSATSRPWTSSPPACVATTSTSGARWCASPSWWSASASSSEDAGGGGGARRWTSRSLVRSRSAKATAAFRCEGPASSGCSLGVLLLNANETVSSDRLTEAAVGGEASPGRGKGAPGTRLAASRCARSATHAAVPLVRFSRPARPGYELRVEPGQLDLHRFEQARGRARRRRRTAGRAAEAAQALHEALSLWRGPALADLSFEGALQTDIARLEELRLDALEERFEADLALGRHAGLDRRSSKRSHRAAASARATARSADARALPLRAGRPRRSRSTATPGGCSSRSSGPSRAAQLKELERRDPRSGSEPRSSAGGAWR